ncbi:hypothetical protein PL321_07710 [Caloramator sp. mosi_1]|uniref:hypothetical protein n=1 Tax=Caloramator sp. mosi_1 TaxID=3023090 RepID=UPI00235ED6BF|nr:hypothetical protein [Caloramator sp. mosi_1]WDC85315.1 hypothetical protein PL321_07710 [Caloramator sp. mosi_1]
MIEKNEILKELKTLQVGIALTTFVFIILGSILVILLAKSITKPIEIAVEKLEVISGKSYRRNSKCYFKQN